MPAPHARTGAETTFFSSAKLNLALQVLGQRADGYHLLDSIVVSAALGDRLTLSEAKDWSLEVSGPQAKGIPADETNLVLRAARAAASLHPGQKAYRLHLEKHLPHGAGLGGGSMNAAVLLHALEKLWHIRGDAWPLDMLQALGADLPVCLNLWQHGWLRMGGIGERVEEIAPPLTELHAVITHPAAGLSTPNVYAACQARDHGAALPQILPIGTNAVNFGSWLAQNSSNALQSAAERLSPLIGQQIMALESAEHCLLARMSGSGTACFGLFAHEAAAAEAAHLISEACPEWWVQACRLGQPGSTLQS